MTAAKRKTSFFLTLVALLFCAPAGASSAHVLHSKTRAELKTLSAPNRTEFLAASRETASRYYDAFSEVASDSLVAPKKTVAEMGDDLANQINKNRVSVRTAGGKKVDIDLRGKRHYDKPTGQYIETPHVHEGQITRGANGLESIDKKTKITRPATPQDIRTAREILKRLGDL